MQLASLVVNREAHLKMKFPTRDGVWWYGALWWLGGTQCVWGGVYFCGSKPQ